MDKYTLENIFNYTEEYLNDFLKNPQLSLLEKRYYTLKLLYENNYIDEKELKYILSPNFVPNLYKTNVVSEIKALTVSLDINQFYKQLKTSQTYNCAESIPIFPIYKQQFTREELDSMGDDELNKLFIFYCIEDPTIEQSGIFHYFRRGNDKDSPLYQEAHLDISKIKKYLDDNPKKEREDYLPYKLTDSIKREMKIITLLYFYYIINRYGYKNVLNTNEPKKIPDINNLPEPLYFDNDSSNWYELQKIYPDWYKEQELQLCLTEKAIGYYISGEFQFINDACANGIDIINQQSIAQLLNIFSIVSKTPCDMMVYKYYSTKIEKNKIDEVNNIYMENRFMSTSINPNIDLGKYKSTYLHLFLPKGTSCLNLVDNYGREYEYEILLPPGTKFHIYKTEKIDKVTYHHAYLV